MANRRREVRFEEMFPWEIAAAMAEAPLCYLPLGTLEWHGEHAAVGLDALKAHTVCVRAAERSGGARCPAPPLVDRLARGPARRELPDRRHRAWGALPRSGQHVLATPRNLPQPAARHLRGDAAPRVPGDRGPKRPLVDRPQHRGDPEDRRGVSAETPHDGLAVADRSRGRVGPAIPDGARSRRRDVAPTGNPPRPGGPRQGVRDRPLSASVLRRGAYPSTATQRDPTQIHRRQLRGCWPVERSGGGYDRTRPSIARDHRRARCHTSASTPSGKHER